MGKNLRWHIVTGEYPPQHGGVADYTRSVARGLANAGDEVHVWAPQSDGDQPADEGVSLRRLSGHFGPEALASLSGELRRLPGRVLLQYTPHAFGYKAMNVPLCVWLWNLRRPLDVMFHEVAFPLESRQPWKHTFLAVVHRGMASLLVRSAQRVFVSIPGWKPLLRGLAARFPRPIWMPIPSNLPTAYPRDELPNVRTQLLGSGNHLVGHFGTYGPSIAEMLGPALLDLLGQRSDINVVLLGKGGPGFAARLIRKRPELEKRLTATGELDGGAAGACLACCDVLMQPYPDGISSRRGSAMAGLSLGCPIVTTEGPLTEPIWRETNAVAMASANELASSVLGLLADGPGRAELGRRAAALYRSKFAIEHTIRALRETSLSSC